MKNKQINKNRKKILTIIGFLVLLLVASKINGADYKGNRKALLKDSVSNNDTLVLKFNSYIFKFKIGKKGELNIIGSKTLEIPLKKRLTRSKKIPICVSEDLLTGELKFKKMCFVEAYYQYELEDISELYSFLSNSMKSINFVTHSDSINIREIQMDIISNLQYGEIYKNIKLMKDEKNFTKPFMKLIPESFIKKGFFLSLSVFFDFGKVDYELVVIGFLYRNKEKERKFAEKLIKLKEKNKIYQELTPKCCKFSFSM
jgi:hypothetical protein